jgi:hypothetical protein
LPSLANCRIWFGADPSVQPPWAQKEYRVVSVPLGVSLNAVPPLVAPPIRVVP